MARRSYSFGGNPNIGWNVRSKRERPNDSNRSLGRFSFFHPALNWTGWDVPVALSAKAMGWNCGSISASLLPVGMRSLRYHCLARGL